MAKEIKIDKVKELQKITDELFEHLEIKPEIEVAESEEVLSVEIHGENLGLLIGQNGENLDSLQLVLSLMLNKKTGEWKPLNVDIGDWRKQKEDSLRQLIASEIDALSEDRREVFLPPMNPSQRRLAHLIVSEHQVVTSQSVGEEPHRYLVIRKD